MSSKLLAAAAFGAFLIAGCTTRSGDLALSSDPNFGEAHRYNAAIQTINPAPVYTAEDAQPGDHGEHGSEAVERYRTGNVKNVEQIRTSSGGAGGGSGPQ